MKKHLLITLSLCLLATAAYSQVPRPLATTTPIPCSDVKDASNPRNVILVCEVAVGEAANAAKLYPALKAKLDAAAAKFAKDKEPLILKLIDDKNPNRNVMRAKQKMDEFIAAGIPISKATQDAVIGALPLPMRQPQPTPSPTPDDGLGL